MEVSLFFAPGYRLAEKNAKRFFLKKEAKTFIRKSGLR
jgi:hypothetical protein